MVGSHSDMKTTQCVTQTCDKILRLMSSSALLSSLRTVLICNIFSNEETEVKGSLPPFFPWVYLRAWIESQVYPIV